MQHELEVMAQPIAQQVAQAQVPNTLRAYGVTPEFLGRLQQAARRLG